MNSYVDFHPIIKNQFGGSKKASICKIFKKGNNLILSNNDLLKTNYSEITAKNARNAYVFKGKELTKREWQLSDQYNWLTYIKEGTGSKSHNQKIFNKSLKILRCNSHTIKVSFDNHLITFPNLILTIPNYVYLNNRKPAKINKINNVSKKISSLAIEAGENIAVGVLELVDQKKWVKKDLLNFNKKIFTGSVKFENLIFASNFCKFTSKGKCAQLVSILYKLENPDKFLEGLRSKLVKKYKSS